MTSSDVVTFKDPAFDLEGWLTADGSQRLAWTPIKPKTLHLQNKNKKMMRAEGPDPNTVGGRLLMERRNINTCKHVAIDWPKVTMEFRGREMDADIIGHAGLPPHEFRDERHAIEKLRQNVGTYAIDCEVVTWYNTNEEEEETEFTVTFLGRSIVEVYNRLRDIGFKPRSICLRDGDDVGLVLGMYDRH